MNLYMKKITVITNQKGGVGKTTTTCSMAGGLSMRGYKVLAIDLDPQGNLSFSVGAETDDSPTVYEVMKGQVPIRDAIQQTKTCDILPSNILLSGAELEFNRPGREHILKEAMGDIAEEYDYVFIDTPPALSILTVNAYTVANSIIIPMVPEILSLQGISQLKETIDTVRKYYNHNLTIEGILLTKYNNRTNLTRDVEDLAKIVARQLNTSVLNAKIRTSVSVAEAPAHCESVLSFAPHAAAAKDYKALIDELLKRGEPNGTKEQ